MARLRPMEVAAQATHVRGLALALLRSGDPVSDGIRRRAAAAPPEAWTAFLRTERWAAPMMTGLEAAGCLPEFPERVRQVLRHLQRFETLRAVRARAQLKEIGAAAKARGWQVIVLKGGRALVESPDLVLGLADLDLLVPPETVRPVTAWLDETGSGAGGYSSPMHAATRYPTGGVAVEVHRTIARDGAPAFPTLWNRAVPIGDGLLGLEPAEHAWHVLSHATISHVDRRGRLRDLAIVARALGACSDVQRAELRHRLERDDFASPLLQVLEMALELAAAEPVSDRFPDLAFSRYAVFELMRRARWPRNAGVPMLPWVFAWIAGSRERRFQWARIRGRSVDRSAFAAVARVERVLPRLGWAMRLSLRYAYGVLAWATGWLVARRIRRAMPPLSTV